MNALNIAPFIEAQSDRIVADDLIAGPRTFNVTSVEGSVLDGKKRLVVHLDSSDKPFIPCKGMSRLLGSLWGPDAAKWVGRTVTLYRDADVRFGADTPGGVRISAVSHIDQRASVPIRISKMAVKKYDIEKIANPNAKQTAEEWAAEHIGAVQNAATLESLSDLIGRGAKPMGKLERDTPALWAEVNNAYAGRRADLEREGPADEQRGDGFTDETEGF